MTVARYLAALTGASLVALAGFAAAAGVARTQPPCWSHSQGAPTCSNQQTTANTTTANTTTANTTTVPTSTAAAATTTGTGATTTAVTSTGTTTTTTAAATTTTTTTTSSAGSPTFDSVTAYLDAPPPSLGSAITVSSASAFATAIANAQAGQVINVLGNVTIPGEFTGFNRIVSGGTVDVVFQPGAGFTGMGGSDVPAVWIRNSGGWRIWGGTITNPQGEGILVYATPGPFTWTGFSVSNTGDTCVALYPVGGNINGVTLKGVAGTASPNLAYDPHAEKGTGIHAWNLADATGGVLENSTIAADVLNQATGAGVEVEMNQIGPNVTLYTRARHLGFAVSGTSWTGAAQTQVAGNVLQLWGGTPTGSLDVKYAEGNNIQGRIVESNGVSGGANFSQSVVEYCAATGPILQNQRLSKVAYNLIDEGGTSDQLKLGTVSPRP